MEYVLKLGRIRFHTTFHVASLANVYDANWV